MLRSIRPLQFPVTLLAGWISRPQLDAIEHLKEENRLLKERLGAHAFDSPTLNGVDWRVERMRWGARCSANSTH